ncbi:MAG: hypothetical protein K0R54_4909 [Clostridiaceae bacterium]|jgi:hypothetical protein|nr:hypothetical protein [Clostridiaceae bacterium]
MLDVVIRIDNLCITNVLEDDIKEIGHWIKLQNYNENGGKFIELNEKELYDRYLECYLSECEFFLKIVNCNKLVGILRGKAEFKKSNEITFMFMLLDHNSTDATARSIIRALTDYFYNEYSINNFYSYVVDDVNNYINSWEKNNFFVINRYKQYYNFNNRAYDMLLLQKK